jgi:hypothetical protein
MKQGLPTETIITYSKTKIFWFMASLLILAGSVYSLLQGGSILKYIMALIGILIGLPMAFFSYVDLRQLRKPQLIISARGIRRHAGEIYGWHQITGEKILYQGNHHPIPYLSINTPYGNRMFNLSDLNIQPDQLLHLIGRYRQLSEC